MAQLSTPEEVAELLRLASVSTVPTVSAWLTSQAHSVQPITVVDAPTSTPEDAKVEETVVPAPVRSKPIVVHKPRGIPTIQLTSYAWDQTDAMIKIFVKIDDAESVPTESVKLTFPSDTTFALEVSNLNGKNYILSVELAQKIDRSASTSKARKGRVILNLKKVMEGKWDVLTGKEKRKIEAKKPKLSNTTKDDDPQASIMNMMRDMYSEGDDDMKRMIGKAWTESRDNKGPQGF
eukprot:m.75283 g.75283  ORF g.75283 m.75283 type:complete len:235 (+) comp24763_c0_seq1:181-885(+)